MDIIVRHVRDMDDADRRALERVIGREPTGIRLEAVMPRQLRSHSAAIAAGLPWLSFSCPACPQ